MLDCVQGHTVYVYDRGGTTRLFQLGKVSLVRYDRLRDEISEALIQLTVDQCREQASILDQIEPIRHELVIYRGQDRVWEGPITLVTETFDGMSISAKDVMYYLYRTVMRNAYSNAYPNISSVVERARNIIETELAAKELREAAAYPDLPTYNVLPYLTDHPMPDDARTSAITSAYQYTVYEHVDSLAADNGLDYTVIGRAIHLWDTHQGLGQTPTVTENDFLGNLIVSRYGSELTTHAHVTDGQGNVGSAGGPDPYYGEIERLVTAYDEEKDAEAPSIPEMQSQAERALVGANPVPLIVRIPDGSSLNPKGVLTIHDLIPGIYIPIRAALASRTYTQLQKLDAVRIEESTTGESVAVTLSPAGPVEGV